MISFIEKIKPIYFLLLAIIAVFCNHVFAYLGHFGYDDLLYAKVTSSFLQGQMDFNEHFSFRTPVILLTALSYSIFGICDFASALPAILVTVLQLYIIYHLLRKEGNIVLILGFGFTLLSQFFLLYTDKLMSDMYVSLSVLAVLFFFHKQYFVPQHSSSITNAALIIVSLLFGFAAKGTIVLIIPLLVYYFATDLIQKRNTKFWIYTIVFGVLALLLYFSLFKLFTGSFFTRFTAIGANSYLNPCSYSEQPLEILLKRIFIDYFMLCINTGLGSSFIFIGAFIFKDRFRNGLNFSNPLAFWSYSALFLLLSGNFMTISFSSYSPMCLDPRHYLFIVPTAAIASAILMKEHLNNGGYSTQILISALLFTLLAYFSQGSYFKYFALPFLILFIASTLLNINFNFKPYFVLALLFPWAIIPASSVKGAMEVNYRMQKKWFIEEVVNKFENSIIITNTVQKHHGNYYSKYAGSNLYIDYRQYKNYVSDDRQKILVTNPYTRKLSGLTQDDLPHFAKHIHKENLILSASTNPELKVYQINYINEPEMDGVKLYEQFQDFELDSNDALSSLLKATQENAYEGMQSGQISHLNSELLIELDSFPRFEKYLIKGSFFVHSYQQTQATVCLQFLDGISDSNLHEVFLDRSIKAYNNWWPVHLEKVFNANKPIQAPAVKISLKQDSEDQIYLDSISLSIYGLDN